MLCVALSWSVLIPFTTDLIGGCLQLSCLNRFPALLSNETNLEYARQVAYPCRYRTGSTTYHESVTNKQTMPGPSYRSERNQSCIVRVL